MSASNIMTSSAGLDIAKEFKEIREILLNELKQGIDEIKRENEIFRASLGTLGSRVEVVEDKIISHDTAIDQWKQEKLKMQSELDLLRDRMTDASNRQRRRNVRIKFLPELDETKNMVPFLVSWWSKLGYRICEDDLERAHRVTPKVPSRRARDTVVAFSREHKRDEFLKFYKSLGQVSYRSSNVLIFADVAPETLQKRNSLKPIAALITKNKLRFSWGFPASIVVFHKGERLVASNMDEGRWLLRKLGISTDPSNPSQERGPDNDLSNLNASANSSHSTDEDSCTTEMESSQHETPASSERKRKDICGSPSHINGGSKHRHKRAHRKKN